MRICTKCNETKPETAFYPPVGRKVCKRCKNRLTAKTSREFRTELKEVVLRHYSPDLSCQCSKCPFKKPGIAFLSLDHINGKGEHGREVRRRLYQWVKNEGYPAGFQVLCFNCNLAKSNKGECPHLEDGEMPLSKAQAMRLSRKSQKK
jgi:hypothetical protein